METLFPCKIGITSLGSLMLDNVVFMIVKGWQDEGNREEMRVDLDELCHAKTSKNCFVRQSLRQL